MLKKALIVTEREQGDEGGDGPLDGLEQEETEEEIEEHLEHHGPGVAHDELVSRVAEGGHEEEGGEVVVFEELVGESEAGEHQQSDEPVDGIDADEAALHEVGHGGEAGRAALAEDDEGEDEAADDEEDVDAEDAEVGKGVGAGEIEYLAGMALDDDYDGDRAEKLQCVYLSDGWSDRQRGVRCEDGGRCLPGAGHDLPSVFPGKMLWRGTVS